MNILLTFNTMDPIQRMALNDIWSLSNSERNKMRYDAACSRVNSYMASNLKLEESAAMLATGEIPEALPAKIAARLRELIAEREAWRDSF